MCFRGLALRACGIVPDQGSNPSPASAGGSFTPAPPRRPWDSSSTEGSLRRRDHLTGSKRCAETPARSAQPLGGLVSPGSGVGVPAGPVDRKPDSAHRWSQTSHPHGGGLCPCRGMRETSGRRRNYSKRKFKKQQKKDAPHPYQRSHCQDVPQVVRSLPRPPGPSAFWTPGQAPCTRSVQKARPWQVGKGGGRSHLCPGISCVRRCSRYSHPTPSEGAGDSAAPSPVASPAGAPSLAQLAATGQPSGSPRAPTTQCPARDAGSTSLPPCSASSLPH